MTEWKKGRSTVEDFDTRLHELRKYGFSFLTALLAAEGILIPAAVAAAATSPGIPSVAKLGIFIVTLLLILALRLIDRYYVLFIKAIVDRTLILERVLNLELTETISQRHRDEKFRISIIGLYISFSVGVGLLGFFILLPDSNLIPWLLGVTASVIVSVLVIERLDLIYGKERGRLDWVVSCTECSRGDRVKITATNLNKRRYDERDRVIVLNPDANPYDKRPYEKVEVLEQGVVWEVRTQDERTVVYRETVGAPIRVRPQDSYTWEWNTTEIPRGFYRLFPTPKTGRVPLLRKIFVGPKKSPKTTPPTKSEEQALPDEGAGVKDQVDAVSETEWESAPSL